MGFKQYRAILSREEAQRGEEACWRARGFKACRHYPRPRPGCFAFHSAFIPSAARVRPCFAGGETEAETAALVLREANGTDASRLEPRLTTGEGKRPQVRRPSEASEDRGRGCSEHPTGMLVVSATQDRALRAQPSAGISRHWTRELWTTAHLSNPENSGSSFLDVRTCLFLMFSCFRCLCVAHTR